MPQVEVQLETNWSAKGISQPREFLCWNLVQDGAREHSFGFYRSLWTFVDLWKTFATQLSGIECRRDGSLRWWLTPLSLDPSQGICRDCSHFGEAISQFAIHSDDGHGTAEKADMDIVDMGLLRIGVLLAKARLSE